MNNSITIDLGHLARGLNLPEDKVARTVDLLDEGNTVPFITRYRKDQTGGLDEEQIRLIQDRVSKARLLAERKDKILRVIDGKKLTPELAQQIRTAATMKRLEDLYLPFRPKKQTRATVARQRGLEPLADQILHATSTDTALEQLASAFISAEKELPDLNAVLAGVGHIVAERLSERADLRGKLRKLIRQHGRLTSAQIVALQATEEEVAVSDQSDPGAVSNAAKLEESAVSPSNEPKTEPQGGEQATAEAAGPVPSVDQPAGHDDSQPPSATPTEQAEPAAEDTATEQAEPATEQAEPPGLEDTATEQAEPAAEDTAAAVTSGSEDAAMDVAATPDAASEEQAQANVEQTEATEQVTPGLETPTTEQPTEGPAAAASAEPASSADAAPPKPTGSESSTPPAPPPTATQTKKLSPRQQKKKKKQEKLRAAFTDYFQFSEPIPRIPPHRILAINRGEKARTLRVRIEVDTERLYDVAAGMVLAEDHPYVEFLRDCLRDALQRLVIPSLEREVRRELTEKAEQHAVEVFIRNLRQLLLQPPVHGRRTLAMDPGFRSGCKLVALDEFGTILGHDVIHVIGNEQRKSRARHKLEKMVERYSCTLIAIGNGTACRETEQLVADVMKKLARPEIEFAIVNEAGASVYSTSQIGREELPSFDATLRSSVSIGRRLLDPLSELVKINPANIGVGMYQHDVKAKHLRESLESVVESCVNYVGVDVNTASPSLLRYVSGLNQLTARRLYEYRQQHGPFKNRDEFRQVPGFGDAAFVQAAGFLKISNGDNPLDATWIHPESYEIVYRVLENIGASVEDLMSRKPVVPASVETTTATSASPASTAPVIETNVASGEPIVATTGATGSGDTTTEPPSAAPESASAGNAATATSGEEQAVGNLSATDSESTPAAEAGSSGEAGVGSPQEAKAQDTEPAAPDASVENAAVENASVENASVENASVENASVENASVENAAVENAAVENAAVENAAVENAAVENAAVENAAVENAAVENAAVENAAAENAAAENAAVENAAVENAAVENAAVENAAVENAAVENAAVENAAVENAAVENAAVENAPADDEQATSELAIVPPSTETPAISGGGEAATLPAPATGMGSAQTITSEGEQASAVTVEAPSSSVVTSAAVRQQLAEIAVSELAPQLNIGELLLTDILSSLSRPGRDPREDFPGPIFRRGIMKMEDLEPGMELSGTVLNVVDFGVFVDIGLSDSALVHISRLADRYVSDPHEVTSVGDVIKVWVMSVNKSRRRVSLTAIEPGTEKPPQQRSRAKKSSEKRQPVKPPKKPIAGKKRPAKPRPERKPPKRPKFIPPITKEMEEGSEPMRTFSDLMQFYTKKQDD